MLLDEILKRRDAEHLHQQREIQAVEQGERAQLSLLEEKVKEVLTMLRSLNSMVNYSPIAIITFQEKEILEIYIKNAIKGYF